MSELVGQIFPERYKGERIVMRTPWVKSAELIIPAGSPPNTAFPNNPFIHSSDLPFEVHACKPRAAQSVAADPFIPIAEPAPGINHFWRLIVESLNISEDFMENAVLVDSLVDDESGFWNFGYPTYLEAGTGLKCNVDSLLPGPNVLRASVAFHGYLILTENDPAYSPKRGG